MIPELVSFVTRREGRKFRHLEPTLTTQLSMGTGWGLVTVYRCKTRITISDNGKGFDSPQKIGDLPRDGKLGLAGMEERARLLGGVLTIQSQPGKGTCIAIEIPE